MHDAWAERPGNRKTRNDGGEQKGERARAGPFPFSRVDLSWKWKWKWTGQASEVTIWIWSISHPEHESIMNLFRQLKSSLWNA